MVSLFLRQLLPPSINFPFCLRNMLGSAVCVALQAPYSTVSDRSTLPFSYSSRFVVEFLRRRVDLMERMCGRLASGSVMSRYFRPSLPLLSSPQSSASLLPFSLSRRSSVAGCRRISCLRHRPSIAYPSRPWLARREEYVRGVVRVGHTVCVLCCHRNDRRSSANEPWSPQAMRISGFLE